MSNVYAVEIFASSWHAVEGGLTREVALQKARGIASGCWRISVAEYTTAEGSSDPLAWYGLAMEYRKLERWDEALQTFASLRTMKQDYVAMYLMCGQMLGGIARVPEAREWIGAGLVQARLKNDGHAVGELESALSTLEE